jgi:hypothetical protein
MSLRKAGSFVGSAALFSTAKIYLGWVYNKIYVGLHSPAHAFILFLP